MASRPLRAGERGRTVTFRRLGIKVFEQGYATVRAVIVGPGSDGARITVNAYTVSDDAYAARISTVTNPFPSLGGYDVTLEAVDGSSVLQLSGEPVRLHVKARL